MPRRKPLEPDIQELKIWNGQKVTPYKAPRIHAGNEKWKALEEAELLWEQENGLATNQSE